MDGRTALFGEGPGGIVVSGPREALLRAQHEGAPAWASWRSVRWAASASHWRLPLLG